MTTGNWRYGLAGSLATLMLNQSVAAQTASTAIQGVVACRAIAGSAARLQCYDRSTKALSDAQGSGELIALDRKNVRETKTRAFGLRAPRSTSPADPFGSLQQIDAPIVGVTRSGYDRLQIAVKDNGIWETLEPLNFPPDVGKIIRITRNNFGGFRASIGKGKTILVKRVR